MDSIYASIAVILIIFGLIAFSNKWLGIFSKKKIYRYKKRQYFLTRAEHEFYNALLQAVGNEYHIFAQVHLPTLLENKIVGQNWMAAFRHINQKSVDFVLCDKIDISPKLAIELDDKSHDKPGRQLRDREVNDIFMNAGMPLLRIKNHGRFDPQELSALIRNNLNQK